MPDRECFEKSEFEFWRLTLTNELVLFVPDATRPVLHLVLAKHVTQTYLAKYAVSINGAHCVNQPVMTTVRMQRVLLYQPVIGMVIACLAVRRLSGAIPVPLIALRTALRKTVTPTLVTVYRAVSRPTGVMFVKTTVERTAWSQTVTATMPLVG